jgi:intracellular multiplication protein IcmJ
MRLAPLVLSARLFALPLWSVSPKPTDQGTKTSCQFCGLSAANWQEPFCYKQDQRAGPVMQAVPACVLCHLALCLDRDTIDREGLLIWCPQLSQGLLNSLVRASHERLTLSDVPLDLSRKPNSGDSDAWGAANVLADLRAQSEAVVAKIGTAAPSALYQGLVEFMRRDGALDARLISGLRLFPLGRFFRGGEDIYPKLMADLVKSRVKGDRNVC